MRASVAAEAAGVPTVSLVCGGFERQALATARGLGFDSMKLAVLRGHVDTQSAEEMIELFLAHTVDEVVAGLVAGADDQADADAVVEEPSALEIAVRGSIDEINRVFLERGWTDGHPVLPPTIERVRAFIDPTGHDPFRVIGTARPSGRDMTVWSIGVNAVMAGCTSDQLPVLLAMAEILAEPSYGAVHSGNTTGADALVVVSGPSMAELGFNSEAGAMREGAHANTAIARWLRLYLRNVCGFTAAEHDKATFGNASRIVLAEHEPTLAEIGWPTLAEDLGALAGYDAVAMARINSGIIVGSVFGSTPKEILPYLANGLVRVTGWELTHVYGLGQGNYQPLLVLSPALARIFARAGWTKAQVQNALYEQALIPARTFEAFMGSWTNLTAGRRTLTDLAAEGLVPPIFAENDDPSRLVPIVTRPDRILIAVAGDPNRANAYVMSNDGLHGRWSAAHVDRRISKDLACRIDRPDLCE